MNGWTLRLQRWAFWLVTGTGVVYFVLKYLVDSSDPFAVVNHPWQPHLQHAHVLVAPLLVFMVGILWQQHVVPKWRASLSGRRTGLSLALTVGPMVASGYLLQVSVSDWWRQFWIWVHCVSSVAWIAVFFLHWIRSRRAPGGP